MNDSRVWNGSPASHQPSWPDRDHLDSVVATLATSPPLVSPADCDLLRDRLADVAHGAAILLQGGDCAETFAAASTHTALAQRALIVEVAGILAAAAGVPAVTVGRIAGQYGKPRTSPTETRGDRTLPAYLGDAVNHVEFTATARTPDAGRLLTAYGTSAATVRLLRRADPAFFTSHEALLLPYEHALIRTDPATGLRYGTSGHLLWVGERTRHVDGAHVSFAAGIANPVAVKLGPTVTPDTVLDLVDRLDPERTPGRLTLITRMGARAVRDVLPPLVEKVAASAAPVSWVCDPMHGNTVVTTGGLKTRYFDTVLDEVAGFFEVHRELGTHPGGLHLELTHRPVTECVGGRSAVQPEDLGRRYESACDPRLNRAQAFELAHLVAELFPATATRS